MGTRNEPGARRAERTWAARCRRAAGFCATAVILASCPECIGSILDSGDRTIQRRDQRDRQFEEAEGQSGEESGR